MIKYILNLPQNWKNYNQSLGRPDIKNSSGSATPLHCDDRTLALHPYLKNGNKICAKFEKRKINTKKFVKI